MSDYTPTRYFELTEYSDGALVQTNGKGFDRWLNAERARIWEEGYNIGADLHLPVSQHINPYRKEDDDE